MPFTKFSDVSSVDAPRKLQLAGSQTRQSSNMCAFVIARSDSQDASRPTRGMTGIQPSCGSRPYETPVSHERQEIN